ncbi:beta-N-acetylhexosaminidase [Rufibacter psychrotolerans]|uniref:beta-N-acetylhexosaminidase n=1 Tax=Rufibacter psychrotolerans TaxID=2812556 RepID=UPI0019681D27|nr:beta-N-acetylhexosaminidase [Rufibacter sp. SYSU D00308]
MLHLRASAQEKYRYAIIPKPVKLEEREGEFTLNKKTTIYLSSATADLKKATDFLSDLVRNATGNPLMYTDKAAKKNSIHVSLDSSITHQEGYELTVSSKSIQIKAKTPAGAFLAVQSLRQLFPADIEASTNLKRFTIPAVHIQDEPRFAYRGVMLDVARHFMPLNFIKKYIDLLAFYKINTFHFHLTEDQGWRIEIKKYPKLQQVGAWRKETLIGHNNDKPRQYDGKRYGGYYTQEELKELVKYAQDRFITIIPEIEMPGHSQAALAAYPELGCSPDANYEVATHWGIFKDIYCPNEATFTFLEDVLTEVMAIFPSKYIHIGGDEAPKDAWKKSAYAQEVIKREGLKDEHELQSYFIQRMEKFLNSKGRSIIGWDEILEGGLAPNATVMSWRGEKGGIAAAKQGHKVIMSPSSHLYIDSYQTKAGRKGEPLAIGRYLPLEKVYSYNPVPKSLTPEEGKLVLGAQANLWTEYIPTSDHAEFMSFPRICALAEITWTPLAQKNYQDFLKRLNSNIQHLDKLKVNYSKYYQSTP